MSSIFSRIIAREIPAYIIAEDAHCIAFLDVFPLSPGHCLVVPKMEVDNLFDLPTDVYDALFRFSRTIAHALKQAVPCKKVGVSVVGLEVPHAHVHLIPINAVANMNFAKEKQKADDAALVAMQQRIQSFLYLS